MYIHNETYDQGSGKGLKPDQSWVKLSTAGFKGQRGGLQPDCMCVWTDAQHQHLEDTVLKSTKHSPRDYSLMSVERLR